MPAAMTQRRGDDPGRHRSITAAENRVAYSQEEILEGSFPPICLSFAGWLLRQRLRLSSSQIHPLAIPCAAIPRAAIFVVAPPLNAAAIAGVIKCMAPVRPPTRWKAPLTPLQ
jgi:hypothetical protein